MYREYIKKPIAIKACPFELGMEDRLVSVTDGYPRSTIVSWYGEDVANDPTAKVKLPVISTLEGGMFINNGDYLIEGVTGEKYPCKKEIFEETYESVEDRQERIDKIHWLVDTAIEKTYMPLQETADNYQEIERLLERIKEELKYV